MVSQEQGETSFVDGTSGEFEDGLRGFRFGGSEVESIQFQKQNSDYKAGALISVDKWMVLDDASGVSSGHLDYVGRSVGKLLARTG